jgi:hypothetical protein
MADGNWFVTPECEMVVHNPNGERRPLGASDAQNEQWHGELEAPIFRCMPYVVSRGAKVKTA